MNSEHDEYPEEEHEDEPARSIFAAGWFRAVLVLTVLAIAVVVALPYLLDWFEPSPPPAKAPVRTAQNAESPSAPTPAALPPVQGAAPRAPQLPPAAANPAAEKERPPAPTPAPPPRVAAPAQTPSAQLPRMAMASDPAPAPSRPAVAAAKPDSTRAENLGGYWIQLGLFKERTNAEGLAKRLRAQGFPIQVAHVTLGEKGAATTGAPAATYHAVRAGAFPDRPRAIAARDELSRKGFVGFIIEGAAK